MSRILASALVFALGVHVMPAGAARKTPRSAPHLESSFAVGWGIDHRNTRNQPSSSIDSTNTARLTLKWVYGLASSTPRSYPLITEDTIYVGDAGRGLVALDSATGCERWVHEHDGPISSAIVQGRIGDRQILVYNDRIKGLYAVDAVNGELVWHAVVAGLSSAICC